MSESPPSIFSPEHIEAAAQFADPRVVICAEFPGVELPAQIWALVVKGFLFMPLNQELLPHLRFDDDSRWFEVDGLHQRFHVPGSAVLGIMDRATGQFLTLRPDLIKAAH